MNWTIGVDVGGTFTDFYAENSASGKSHVFKLPSTPGNPAEAILRGFVELCQSVGIKANEVVRVSHGTTVATNALIQDRGAPVVLITTKGFRDLLEIGRQIRPRLFDFQADFPPALVPRERRFEVDERVKSDGSVLRAPDSDDLARAISAIGSLKGVKSCAVCLLFSFLNPAHERQIRTALVKEFPDLAISISSDVQPEFREYERLSTTVMNSYLQPVMDGYLHDLEVGLKEAAPHAVLGINQSSGGLMSVDRARRFPVRTALSGPAAGAIGAIDAARQSECENIITLDMGGTSADVALIQNYEIGITFDRSIKDYPIRLPCVDINAVGAGGGSIAWFDRDGLMKVGPTSAGAEPGPVCYGRGGTEPSVTDANVVLGRLSPKGLLGGGMALDVKAAHEALVQFGKRLGLSAEQTAHGIIGIVVANMVRAVRGVSVERGYDPRNFTLLPFGGAGPLHAADVARSLGISKILIPRSPGILCAQGLIYSDLKETFVRTRVTRVEASTMNSVGEIIGDLRAQALSWLTKEGFKLSDGMLRLTFDIRYVGQNFELSVDLGDKKDSPTADEVKNLFFKAHDRSYGYHNPNDAIEIINFRLTALVKLRDIAPVLPSFTSHTMPVAEYRRPVWFDSSAAKDTPIYWRDKLQSGQGIIGPAIVEQLDATIVIFPNDRLTVDSTGNLLMEITA